MPESIIRCLRILETAHGPLSRSSGSSSPPSPALRPGHLCRLGHAGLQGHPEALVLTIRRGGSLDGRRAGSSGRNPQFVSCSWIVASIRWILTISSHTRSRQLTYEKLMYHMAVARCIHTSIDPSWNSLETYREVRPPCSITRTCHPTLGLARQSNGISGCGLARGPQRRFHHQEAGRGAYLQGSVRPSLLHQVDLRVVHAADLPPESLSADRSFVPPFRRMEVQSIGTADKILGLSDASTNAARFRSYGDGCLGSRA